MRAWPPPIPIISLAIWYLPNGLQTARGGQPRSQAQLTAQEPTTSRGLRRRIQARPRYRTCFAQTAARATQTPVNATAHRAAARGSKTRPV